MDGARIGSRCNICDHVFIESGVVVGNGVTIKNGVAIWDLVTIDDGAFLGPNCVFTNDLNPRAAIRKTRAELVPTRVGADATIGANATIVCGVSIGRHAFVGAGAVVTRSIPDFGLVVGNPARQTGWMCVCAEKLKLASNAGHGTQIDCKACGRAYVMRFEGLTLTDAETLVAHAG
jgi:acetyltransferase-like isoleucine patch superfamily enzyme